MNKQLKLLLVLLTLSWQIQVSVQAADRALIIGITEYQNSKYNLPGIDLDVAMAEKVAKMLAFETSQTKTLTGKQASKKNIKKTINDWLINGTTADDRVFLYFSGHGGRLKDKNNDEEDGQDEYITAYDLGETAKQGGYIIDDELSMWLKNIPSQHKIVMLDSCHSGTATRGLKPSGQQMGQNVLYSKKHKFGQASTVNILSKGRVDKGQNSGFLDGHKNLITLAAARDYEAAQASEKGSLFTLGFFQALSKSTQDGSAASALDLVEQAGQFIAESLADDLDYIHKPLIFGDFQLAQKPLTTKPSRNSQGPNWLDLLKLSTSGKPMSASANKPVFNVGELIKFNLNIPTKGYLNIINVDAHDAVTVIYPNQFNPENRINAGTINIPGDLMAFDIEATKPAGESLTVFVITTKPLNLYKDSLNVRNGVGEFTETFAGVSQYAYRSMRVRAREQKDEIYTTAVKTSVK